MPGTAGTITYEVTCVDPDRARAVPSESSSMDERIREALAGDEAYVVGGAIRDELLGRPVLDVDVACHEPERAARAYRDRAGGALFPLSERHGAWRVALDAVTVDFTPLRGSIVDDLAGRDFTINAIAEPLAGGERIDPFGGEADIGARGPAGGLGIASSTTTR